MRGKKLFPSTLLLWGKRIMLLSLMSAAMWGCSKEPQQTIHWHNAYDIERELHLLGQQEDLKKSGDLMKEIVKGQQQFFNDGQKGNANQGGKASPSAPKRSPSETGI